MNRDYFLNHELIDDKPLLHLAFYGIRDEVQQKQIDEANEKALKLVFEKMTSIKNNDVA